MWMIIAILFIVFAILLAIPSITMGAILCRSRKSIKAVSTSKLTTHQQGIYVQVHTYNAVNMLGCIQEAIQIKGTVIKLFCRDTWSRDSPVCTRVLYIRYGEIPCMYTGVHTGLHLLPPPHQPLPPYRFYSRACRVMWMGFHSQ